MRISKSTKYAVEQFLIQKQIISLLNLEEGFYLYEMDRDVEKQQTIMNMVPEIWQFFAHMNVTGLLYPKKCKRAWLSIVRGVLKNRYSLKYKACRYLSNDGSVFTMKYYTEPLCQMKKGGSSDSLNSISYSDYDTSNDSDSISDSSDEDSSSSSSKLTLKLKKKRNKIKLELHYRRKSSEKSYVDVQKTSRSSSEVDRSKKKSIEMPKSITVC